MSRQSLLLLLPVLAAIALAFYLVNSESHERSPAVALGTAAKLPEERAGSESEALVVEEVQGLELAGRSAPGADLKSTDAMQRTRTPEGPTVYEPEPTRTWLLEINVFPELQPGESLALTAISHEPGFAPGPPE